MMIEIRDRWTGDVMFTTDHGSLALAVTALVADGKNLSGANLRDANLRDANLSGAKLSGADLRDAYLSRANLSGADLSRANLRDANLRDANLSGANLSGADLSGAKLSGADLSGAKGYSKYRSTPLLMLLDQPGPIRAYKLVTATGQSPITTFAPLSYSVGQSLEVFDANTDELVDCGAGINVATLDWCMRHWEHGWRILVLEFEAKDIAAIPTANDGKFRLHRGRVVGEKDLREIGLIEDQPAKAEGK